MSLLTGFLAEEGQKLEKTIRLTPPWALSGEDGGSERGFRPEEEAARVLAYARFVDPDPLPGSFKGEVRERTDFIRLLMVSLPERDHVS